MNEVKTLFGRTDAPRRIALVGVPFDSASTLGKPGARYAPTRIRTALGWNLYRVRDGAFYDVNSERIVRMDDYAVVDYGDCFVHGADHMQTLQNAQRPDVRRAAVGAFAIGLGGDHEVSHPAAAGLPRLPGRTAGIIHVDAHLDLVDENPRQGRFSGSSPMRRGIEMGRFDPQRLIQVGVRGFNYAEQYEFIQKMGIHHIPASRFHEIGPRAAAQIALEKASRRQRQSLPEPGYRRDRLRLRSRHRCRGGRRLVIRPGARVPAGGRAASSVRWTSSKSTR